jgi:dCMP deaminase
VKICSLCKTEKDDSKFHKRILPSGNVSLRSGCIDCNKKYRNIDLEYKNHLKRTYDLSKEEYDFMLKKQGNKCAICSRSNEKRLSVDHDHITNEIRGLLCTSCNRAIGVLGDDLDGVERALHYLNRKSHDRRSWDNYFIRLAREASSRSSDESTQVGAIIERNKKVLATGYNGFPSKVQEMKDRIISPEKYNWVSHAESNAILMCAKEGINISGSTIYVYPLAPCNECAKAIIQSGVEKVIARVPITNDNWTRANQIAEEMFLEAGIKFNKI